MATVPLSPPGVDPGVNGERSQRSLFFYQFSLLARILLISLDRHVTVDRRDLHGVAGMSQHLGGHDLGAGAGERLIADLPGHYVLAHRDGEELDRLGRRVLRLGTWLYGRHGPDGRRVFVRNAGRFVPPDPAIETGLVLPHVVC